MLSRFVYNAVVLLCCVPMARTTERVLPPHPQRLRRAAVYALFTAAALIPSWVGDENPILLFPVFLLVFLTCFDGDRLAKLVTGGIYYTLVIPIGMMLDTADRWYTPAAGDLWSVGVFIKLFLWTLLAWALRRGLPRERVHLSRRLWMLLGGLTVGPLMSVLSFSLWNYHRLEGMAFDHFRDTSIRLASTILPFTCLSALALLFAIALLARHDALEREARLAELREVYYEDLKREQTQVRALRHDLRNHLTALQGLLEQGSFDRALDYLDALADSPALVGSRRCCENEVANAVLSSKAAIMEAEGLKPDFSVSLPADLPIPAPDLCALLGNALDNAMEAARAATDKRVILRAKLEKGLFMLRVENALGAVVNPDLSTTKADARHHGFGLAGMREIARQQGGSLEARIKNGRFELIVYLPVPVVGER